MSKEKLAIISSYDELCGNASYTKALVAGLSTHYDVTVIPLNVGLLRNGERKNARKHIDNVCKQLQAFDCVNIQFEVGLFGTSRRLVVKNFVALAKASKRLVLTMHRYDEKRQYPRATFMGKALLKGKFKKLCLKASMMTLAQNRYASLYRKVIKFCVARKVPIIVHTPRDRELISEKFEYDQVFDHPLCFYDQDYIHSASKAYSRADLCNDLGLDDSKKFVGIFGFINVYKAHDTAIRAIKELPEDYELLIFGSQHPLTILSNEPVDEYLSNLLELVEDLKVSSRVKFFRMSSDEDFLKTLLCCDFNVVPYMEVNQGGSAIAALSLETNSNVIFSQNKAFLELAKYAPEGFQMFSIGNHFELATAILSYRKSKFAPHLEAYHKKYNIATSANLYKRLLSRRCFESPSVQPNPCQAALEI